MKRLFILGIASMLLSSAGLAEPILTTQVSSCLGTVCENDISSQAGTLYGGSGFIDFSNAAMASYGVMHVSSRSNFSVTDEQAFAGGYASFQDVLTISDRALDGQTGILLIGYDLDGTVSQTGISSAFLQLAARVFAPTLQNYLIDYQSTTATSALIPQPFYFTFGSPFTLYFSLQAATGTEAVLSGGGYVLESGSGSGTGVADFSNTFTLSRLAVEDAGGNPVSGALFSSDSGTIYGQDGVVPEPSALLLIVPGIAFFGFRRKSYGPGAA